MSYSVVIVVAVAVFGTCVVIRGLSLLAVLYCAVPFMCCFCAVFVFFCCCFCLLLLFVVAGFCPRDDSSTSCVVLLAVLCRVYFVDSVLYMRFVVHSHNAFVIHRSRLYFVVVSSCVVCVVLNFDCFAPSARDTA